MPGYVKATLIAAYVAIILWLTSDGHFMFGVTFVAGTLVLAFCALWIFMKIATHGNE